MMIESIFSTYLTGIAKLGFAYIPGAKSSQGKKLAETFHVDTTFPLEAVEYTVSL
jgi:hypothetical protein